MGDRDISAAAAADCVSGLIRIATRAGWPGPCASDAANAQHGIAAVACRTSTAAAARWRTWAAADSTGSAVVEE